MGEHGQHDMGPGEVPPSAPSGEDICPTCHGSGQIDDGKRCPRCGGGGRIVEPVGGG